MNTKAKFAELTPDINDYSDTDYVETEHSVSNVDYEPFSERLLKTIRGAVCSKWWVYQEPHKQHTTNTILLYIHHELTGIRKALENQKED